MIATKNGLNVTKPNAVGLYTRMGLGGVAGAGKTMLTGLVGPENSMLSFDLENGTATFNTKAYREHPHATENIDIVQFNDITSARDLVHRVESGLDYLIKSGNKEGYDVVVIDSLTEFQQRFLSLHQANDPRQSYGAWRDSLYSIIHKASQVKAHVVFTSRLKAVYDEVLSQEIVRFDVAPSAWNVFSGLCTVLALLSAKNRGIGKNAKTIRTLDTNHTQRFPGKDRHDIGEIEDPSFLKIMNAIKGED